MKEYTTDAYGPTVSIDCACTKDSLGTLVRIAGNASRVITMGFSIAPTEVTNFGITSKELDIRGSRLQNRKFQAAIDLVNEGKLDLDHKISHTFHFPRCPGGVRFQRHARSVNQKDRPDHGLKRQLFGKRKSRWNHPADIKRHCADPGP